MNVRFKWEGQVNSPEGLAIYTVGNSAYHLRLPSFKKANMVYSALRDIFEEGRRLGQREMKYSVIAAIDEVEQKL